MDRNDNVERILSIGFPASCGQHLPWIYRGSPIWVSLEETRRHGRIGIWNVRSADAAFVDLEPYNISASTLRDIIHTYPEYPPILSVSFESPYPHSLLPCSLYDSRDLEVLRELCHDIVRSQPHTTLLTMLVDCCILAQFWEGPVSHVITITIKRVRFDEIGRCSLRYIGPQS